MALSDTGDAVREVLYDAIKDIASTKLGMDNGNTVHNYLFGEEISVKRGEYLMATIGGKKEARAWGIQVYTYEDLEQGMGQKTNRFYEVVIEGYYGAHGSTPFNTMLTHAQYIREAIKDLGVELNRRVNFISSSESFRLVDEEVTGDSSIEILTGRMGYKASKLGASW